MGLSYADLTIADARKPELLPMKIRAMADTGALHLCIPHHVMMQLQLEELEKREVTLADGSKQLLPYVGPIHLRFGNRSGFMGAIPMEDLDLVMHPTSRSVTVNPLNPNFPASVAKGLRHNNSSKRTDHNG